MREVTLNADKVRSGHTITKVVIDGEDQQVRRRWGRWPTATNVEYRQIGEGGNPTIYLGLSSRPGWDFCLRPDDQVTVQVEDHKQGGAR